LKKRLSGAAFFYAFWFAFCLNRNDIGLLLEAGEQSIFNAPERDAINIIADGVSAPALKRVEYSHVLARDGFNVLVSMPERKIAQYK